MYITHRIGASLQHLPCRKYISHAADLARKTAYFLYNTRWVEQYGADDPAKTFAYYLHTIPATCIKTEYPPAKPYIYMDHKRVFATFRTATIPNVL